MAPQINAAPSQIVRYEMVLAYVVGGGTSGVVLRGDEGGADGVRVSVHQETTSGDPEVETSATAAA